MLLGLVKCAGPGDLGHDRTPKLTRLARRLHGFLRHSLIGVVMIKNRRAILRANVRTLPVERGGIVRLPEHRQHFFEGKFCRVKIHLDHLGMPRAACADLFVCGIGHLTTHVAGGHFCDALDTLVNRLHTPKTSSAECDGFGLGHFCQGFVGWIHNRRWDAGRFGRFIVRLTTCRAAKEGRPTE